MISSYRLKFGRAPGLPGESMCPTAVTVFVGPNNSGKSKVLSEINHFACNGHGNLTDLILDEMQFSGIPADRITRAIDQIRLAVEPADNVGIDGVIVGRLGIRQTVPLSMLTEVLENPSVNTVLFGRCFLKLYTLMLDGPGRIALSNPQPFGDLQQHAQSSFQTLFRDNERRNEVRQIIWEAFACYFVLDPTNAGQLRVRLAPRPPSTEIEERGIHQEAVQFHASAQSIDTASDGVKAFTGIITELIAGDPRILLVDEPEAFLHPSLAFKLGYEVSRAALGSNKRVFASTHSPNFVMGCIQSGAPVTIIRLTYQRGVPTARVLPSGELLQLMRNPLLRSTGVMGGLFYDFVVVTESDSDRAFYQEINERLIRFKPEWGIPNCLFLNAQNKQTVRTILRPLRNLGIPAAGIVDVDVIKDGGRDWTGLLTNAGVPQLQHQSLSDLRTAINAAFKATAKDMKRDGGIFLLSRNDRAAAENLLKQIAEYGIFAVPTGELESWLKSVGASGHGPAWLIDVFEKIGEDPESSNYLKPSTDDVWRFMSNVKTWLTNPNRKGIPD